MVLGLYIVLKTCIYRNEVLTGNKWRLGFRPTTIEAVLTQTLQEDPLRIPY